MSDSMIMESRSILSSPPVLKSFHQTEPKVDLDNIVSVKLKESKFNDERIENRNSLNLKELKTKHEEEGLNPIRQQQRVFATATQLDQYQDSNSQETSHADNKLTGKVIRETNGRDRGNDSKQNEQERLEPLLSAKSLDGNGQRSTTVSVKNISGKLAEENFASKKVHQRNLAVTQVSTEENSTAKKHLEISQVSTEENSTAKKHLETSQVSAEENSSAKSQHRFLALSQALFLTKERRATIADGNLNTRPSNQHELRHELRHTVSVPHGGATMSSAHHKLRRRQSAQGPALTASWTPRRLPRRASVVRATSNRGFARLHAALQRECNKPKWPPGYAQERFKHAIRIVLILLKWISSLSESGEEEGEGGGGKTFTDIASEAFDSGRFGSSGLTFDLSYYKAKKVINISAETRHILSIPSNVRTPEMIQTALYGLQHLKSFAEYPLHMQEKLCKVAWFQQVPAKRVIIRQGHFAENFYFILSGQAVVRILEKNPNTGDVQLRTATILRKGTSFGELALLHHSRRTATVVSQDTVQLLTIGRDDFFDIFMSGNAPGEIPEHIKFISHLDFMKDWPIDKMLEHPECCLFHFFKRGVVIVKDSTQSDWLYIIKSGSCQVMKQLKGVRPKVGRPNSSNGGRPPFILPRLGTGDVDSKVDTGRRKLTPRSTVIDAGLQRVISDYTTFVQSRTGVSPSPDLSSSISTNSPTSKRSMTPRSTRTTVSPSKRCKTPGSARASRAELPVDPYFDEEGLVLKDPVFVQVQTLKPKDVFGLGTVEFENEPASSTTAVSLVSNGAECIMLSKKFFVEHANELVKKTVRYSIRPYPTETALQDNLQSKVDWDVYKKRLIKSTLDFLENGVH